MIKNSMSNMTNNKKQAIKYSVILNLSLLIVTIAFCIVQAVFADHNSDILQCRFKEITNLYCPTCGGTRALNYLLRFDIINAFICYPPIFAGIFAVSYMNILYIKCFVRDSLEPIAKHRYTEFVSIPISIIFNFVIRNILLVSGIDYIGDIIK